MYIHTNCTLKTTEFYHSLWILFTKCWNLICCAPKIAFRSFGYEKQKKEICIIKADHTCTSFWILMTALFLPLWISRHHGLYSFLSFNSWAVCMYRENGLTKTCSSSLFLLLNFCFWFSLWMHEVREWISFLFIFFSQFTKIIKKYFNAFFWKDKCLVPFMAPRAYIQLVHVVEGEIGN